MLRIALWILAMGFVNALIVEMAGLAGISRSDFSLSVFKAALTMLSYHFFVNPLKSAADVIIIFIGLLLLDRFLNRPR